ncbi:MAG TPA: peptidase M23 [Cytophagales bacterium]|nr:peptidase M23 [Cytophagales bacterium]
MTSLKKIYFISAAALFVVVVLFTLLYTSLVTLPGDYEIAVDSSKLVTIEKPVIKYGMKVNGMEVKEGFVKRNQIFVELLKGTFVKAEVLKQLTLLPRSVFDFRKVNSSKKYALIHQTDSAQTAVALVYEPDPVHYTIFHLQDSLVVENHEREVKTEEKSVTGVIASSLSETIASMNITNELTNKFVDVFGWQVDFQHLQKGDRFKLIYEEKLVEDQPFGIGNILGIYFEHFGHGYYAFPFDQGEGLDYFDEEGKSLRKALLRYPIEFTRISSRYTNSRFHPILKVFTPHLGIDFASAVGTPIRTVGDGVVQEARYSANNGNYVKIRHNGTYSTAYLHMSKIASGIVAGTTVRQGQTIGYVGTTGLSTGPHLCYRLWRNNVQVDALRIELPPSKPVDKKNWKKFEDIVVMTTVKLQSIPFESEDPVVATR